MVQVLPQVPGFGDRLGQVLGEALGNVGQGYAQGVAKKSALENFLKLTQKQPSSPPPPGSVDSLNPENNQTVAQPSSPPSSIKTLQAAEQLGIFTNPDLAKLWAGQEFNKQNLSEKENLKEQSAIRAEERKKIDEFSKPYRDLNKLRQNTNKLEEAKRFIQSGKVSFDENQFRTFVAGVLEEKNPNISELFKTPEQQQVAYLIRDFLNTKDIGGSNPSTREVLLTLATRPGPFKGRLANEYIVESMLNEAKNQLKVGESINGIKKSSKALTFEDFQSQLDKDIAPFAEENQKRLTEMFSSKQQIGDKKLPAKHVWMVSSDGQVGAVHLGKVKEAEAMGYKRVDG